MSAENGRGTGVGNGSIQGRANETTSLLGDRAGDEQPGEEADVGGNGSAAGYGSVSPGGNGALKFMSGLVMMMMNGV